MKKLISLLVSLIILYFIYSRVGATEIISLLRQSDPFWLFCGFFMFIPTTLLTSFRFRMLSSALTRVSMAESVQLILAASSLNMVLPSKMGDIAKGYFVADRSNSSKNDAFSLVVYEKFCDMLAILFLCVIGIFFYRNYNIFTLLFSLCIVCGFIFGMLMIGSQTFYTFFFKTLAKFTPKAVAGKIEKFYDSWDGVCSFLKSRSNLKLNVSCISVIIWLMHLLQIWFFIRMLNAYVPILSHMVLTPMSIFAGLLPFTFAGVGMRDAALIYFFEGYLTSVTAASLGILCTLRYLIPALFGLIFLNKYIVNLKMKSKP